MSRLLILPLLLASCGVVPGPPDAGEPQWFTTCGDPVCSEWREHPGVPLCTTETVGVACSPDGAQCDPKNDCNALLTCATADPKLAPGGCPISRRRYKKDVRYLDRAGLLRFHDELRDLKLATYRYVNAAPGSPERLGFMIDDVGPGVTVDPERDQVDLYGYTSLAIAALKVQAEQLDALRAEVEQLKAERLSCTPVQ